MNARQIIALAFILFVHPSGWGQDLHFHRQDNNLYRFDTGVLRGTMLAGGKVQGIVSLVDCETGIELAHQPGVLSYYRVFANGTRFPDARVSPNHAVLGEDGSLKVEWGAECGYPFSLQAIYQWTAPVQLDLETVVTAREPCSGLEVFLSSYFVEGFKGYIYAKETFLENRPACFLAAEVSPLTLGTYLAFPRDRESVRSVFDGRWELGEHPVQWSITQFYGYPLAMKQDAANKRTFLMMSHPDDCFAVLMSYDKEPPDGIASHRSLYFSLFGGRLEAGATTRARTRLIFTRQITSEEAVQLYQTFLSDKPYAE